MLRYVYGVHMTTGAGSTVFPRINAWAFISLITLWILEFK